jgi:uncharacterized surface protein with fasciclin (FAS1) repeats
MKNFYRSTLALIAGALLSLPMMASADDSSKHHGKSYFNCLRTSLDVFDGTIAEAAAATPDLSTLYTLVGLAGLGEALSGTDHLTVYAPTNAAFEKLPTALVDLLTADPTGLLTTVLTYHVSSGIRDPRRAFFPKETSTLQGQTVFLENERGDGPQVNQSNVNCKGVKTNNGVVWLIDSVLLPQFK